METPAEKPATAPSVTIEDLREFRRTAWRNVLGWQLLVDAVCVALGVLITDGWSGIVAMSIVLHIPIIVLVLLPKLRWAVKAKLDEVATDAAAANRWLELIVEKAKDPTKRDFIWKTFCDDAGIVRKSTAAKWIVALTAVVVVILVAVGAKRSGISVVIFFASTFWWMIALDRESGIIKRARMADRFPEHTEIQLFYRLQRVQPRLAELAWATVILLSSFAALIFFNPSMAASCSPLLLPVCLAPLAKIQSGESAEQRRARLVRLILDRSSPAYRGAGQWLLTDWGRVRPIIFVGFVLAIAAIHLWFKIKFDIIFRPDAIQIFVAFWWIYFSFSCLYPFAYWKMMAARSGADAAVQPAMTEPRP